MLSEEYEIEELRAQVELWKGYNEENQFQIFLLEEANKRLVEDKEFLTNELQRLREILAKQGIIIETEFPVRFRHARSD